MSTWTSDVPVYTGDSRLEIAYVRMNAATTSPAMSGARRHRARAR